MCGKVCNKPSNKTVNEMLTSSRQGDCAEERGGGSLPRVPPASCSGPSRKEQPWAPRRPSCLWKVELIKPYEFCSHSQRSVQSFATQTEPHDMESLMGQASCVPASSEPGPWTRVPATVPPGNEHSLSCEKATTQTEPRV